MNALSSINSIFWLNCLFSLVAFKGARSQAQLVESGGDVKKPGDSIRLSCKASGFFISSNWLDWIRHAPGKGLEWVSSIDSAGTPYYLDSVKGQFTISRDASNNLVHLHISSLKPEDAGMYHCARDMG
ncbi:hypothetical protein G0U57_017942, partial [Chelydra serpentina]